MVRDANEEDGKSILAIRQEGELVSHDRIVLDSTVGIASSKWCNHNSIN